MKIKYDNSNAGKIMEKINITQYGKAYIGIGILVLCGMIGICNKNEAEQLGRYSSYSEQIESMYDVDISSSNEEILNSMQKNLDLVNQYNDALTDDERYDALQKMIETKSKLNEKALKLVKNDVSEEYGGDPSLYKIYYDSSVHEYAAQEYEEKYTKVVFVDSHSLNGKQKRLVDYIINLDDSTYDKKLGIGKESKEFVEKYEFVIKESAKYLGKISDKAK